MFLMRECDDLSSSRAYELISIANGTKTVEEVRKAWRDRHPPKSPVLPERTESHTDQPLDATKSEKSKPVMGRPAAPKTFEARLTALIAQACKSLDAEQLDAGGFPRQSSGLR